MRVTFILWAILGALFIPPNPVRAGDQVDLVINTTQATGVDRPRAVSLAHDAKHGLLSITE